MPFDLEPRFVLRRRHFTRVAFVVIGIVLFIAFSILLANPPRLAPAYAQRFRIDEVGRQIQQQLPDIPLENEYVNRETGEVSPNNTLLTRLIRYHIYIKGRPVNYRLDWKLTLADYLGVNERMEPATYPSGDTLRTNPIEGDRAAIRSLTRAQREALVQALVSAFNPQAANPEPVPQPSPAAPSPVPAMSPAPRFPQEPQPGDANLLAP
ncbi:MAG: hypothetical protein IGS38_16795 [Synechococcales cyanobacterium M58_A2018_015]|nr:hypothetical protein [Synechococcales cyanobacterium M58_A2018_015]